LAPGSEICRRKLAEEREGLPLMLLTASRYVPTPLCVPVFFKFWVVFFYLDIIALLLLGFGF
jgi:hypothetical protein